MLLRAAVRPRLQPDVARGVRGRGAAGGPRRETPRLRLAISPSGIGGAATPPFLRGARRRWGSGLTLVPALADAARPAFVHPHPPGVAGRLSRARHRRARPALDHPRRGGAWRQAGRTIGFPTANVALGRHLEPARGVYAVTVRLPDRSVLAGVGQYRASADRRRPGSKAGSRCISVRLRRAISTVRSSPSRCTPISGPRRNSPSLGRTESRKSRPMRPRRGECLTPPPARPPHSRAHGTGVQGGANYRPGSARSPGSPTRPFTISRPIGRPRPVP